MTDDELDRQCYLVGHTDGYELGFKKGYDAGFDDGLEKAHQAFDAMAKAMQNDK